MIIYGCALAECEKNKIVFRTRTLIYAYGKCFKIRVCTHISCRCRRLKSRGMTNEQQFFVHMKMKLRISPPKPDFAYVV